MKDCTVDEASGLSDPVHKEEKEKKNPAFLHLEMYKPFIVATTMSSALKGGCCARSGGHVAMATVGVNDGWLVARLWCVGEREAAGEPTLLLG